MHTKINKYGYIRPNYRNGKKPKKVYESYYFYSQSKKK